MTNAAKDDAPGLSGAIAELQQYGPWASTHFLPTLFRDGVREAIATILNAVLDGTLVASETVQAMLREARAEGMERAQMLARRLANDSEREAERKETTAQQRIGLYLVRDTAGTLEAAIRAEAAAVRKGETK